MHAKWLTSIVLALVAIAAFPAPAYGGPADGDNAGEAVDLIEPYIEDGELKIEIVGADGVVTVIGGSLPEWMRVCRWEVMTAYDRAVYLYQFSNHEPLPYDEWAEAGLDPDELWNMVFCPPTPEIRQINGVVVFTGVLESFPVGGTPPQIIQDWIVAQAIASVPIPVQVGQSAPFGDDAAPMITQLPSWLWVDDAVWQPVSATPPPVFGTTATATATPYRVEFFGHDGEYVDCGPNLGPVYDFGVPEDAQSSDCTITFRHSSSVGEFELVSKIYWEITWVCTQFCGAGTLDATFTTTRTRAVRVAELQALGTSIGSE